MIKGVKTATAPPKTSRTRRRPANAGSCRRTRHAGCVIETTEVTYRGFGDVDRPSLTMKAKAIAASTTGEARTALISPGKARFARHDADVRRFVWLDFLGTYHESRSPGSRNISTPTSRSKARRQAHHDRARGREHRGQAEGAGAVFDRAGDSAEQHPNADRLRCAWSTPATGLRRCRWCAGAECACRPRQRALSAGTFIAARTSRSASAPSGRRSRGMLCSAAGLEISKDPMTASCSCRPMHPWQGYAEWAGLGQPVLEDRFELRTARTSPACTALRATSPLPTSATSSIPASNRSRQIPLPGEGC